MYRAVKTSALVWREWNDGCAVFNRLTGETHFLDLTSSYVLRLLEIEPGTVPEIVDRVAAGLDRDQDDVLVGQIRKTIGNLVAMGVAEPVA